MIASTLTALLFSMWVGVTRWWPAPEDTFGDRDPLFDSVIVIWQPTVADVETGQISWIANAAGAWGAFRRCREQAREPGRYYRRDARRTGIEVT